MRLRNCIIVANHSTCNRNHHVLRKTDAGGNKYTFAMFCMMILSQISGS